MIVTAVAVALLGEVLLRWHTSTFMTIMTRRPRRAVARRGVGAVLVSVVVGIALSLAVAQILERLHIVSLVVLALLLGFNRAVGLGVGSLLVFSVWQPDLAVLLWFVAPLLVVSVVTIGVSGWTSMLFGALDIQEGPTPWTLLLTATAGGAAAWAIWSWSGWASVAVLASLLVFVRWFRLTGTVPAPWRVQLRRREWFRFVVVGYLAFSPVGSAVVDELAEFRPTWVLMVAMPLAAGVALATFPVPYPTAPTLVPAGARIRQTLAQGGLFAALLSARFPESPVTPALLTTVALVTAGALVAMALLRATPFNQVVAQDLIQLMGDTDDVFDDWAWHAIIRRRHSADAGLLTMLAAKAEQSLDNRTPTTEALLNLAPFDADLAMSRARDPFDSWTFLVEQALSAVERGARRSGRDVGQLLPLLRAAAARPELARAMRSRHLDAAGEVLATQTECYDQSGLAILRDENRLLEARIKFGAGDDAGGIAIAAEILAQPHLDAYNRRDALLLLTMSSVLDGDRDAVAEYREASAGLRVRWSDRRQVWAAAWAMRPILGVRWLRIPPQAWRGFKNKHATVMSDELTPQLALDIFDTLGAKSRILAP
ncbi:hypothetical protein [Asanoa hainanensis]|uniref:hypothetical protein n=1 Tax=Asanoa hainanensis TaxID=560556 RepID=UPI00117F1023|nr:hypothetical protein [Asanoa hainanensis]